MTIPNFFVCRTVSESNRQNRKIFYGPVTCTWPVPSGTTEVEVHVWGGGGSGESFATPTPNAAAGGGGGGYARARYMVTDSDSLSITVGGPAGTSSVTIPTQSPTSPISATGGSSGSGSPPTGGAGGSGSVSLGPQHPTYYCFTASGGQGGTANGFSAAGGGGAGSPLGPGGTSKCMNPSIPISSGGGGFGGSNGFKRCTIYRTSPGTNTPIAHSVGGSVLQGNVNNYSTFYSTYAPSISDVGTAGAHAYIISTCTLTSYPIVRTGGNTLYQVNAEIPDEWFYVEDIKGVSGNYAYAYIDPAKRAGDGAGGVGCVPGGFGGGGGCNACGGYAGGGGGRRYGPTEPSTACSGGPGVVILYW
jgi:hypothetical protein